MPYVAFGLEAYRTLAGYLIGVGYDVNFVGNEGLTPFLLAAKWNLPQTITCLGYLLDSGANAELKDDYGRGALHLALKNSYWGTNYDEVFVDETDFVDSDPMEGLEGKLLFLLQAGCDPAAKDNNGDTVADYAEWFELTEVWLRALTRFYTNLI